MLRHSQLDEPLYFACSPHVRLRNAVYHFRGTAQPHQPITPERLVTRKLTPLPGKPQTFAARLTPIARPASARTLLSP